MSDQKIVIIGAGVAGLIAAIELEKKGIKPLVIEATDRVGGRVKTDNHEGFLLDHGFQVLLTEYPEAKRYLDYEKLDLKLFKPGALIFDKDKSYKLADPLRDPGEIFAMAFSPAGSIGDKVKVWQLSQKLKKTSIVDIFDRKASTTQEYLKDFGFSEKIIESFFRPFFSGIFLENQLSTSSRMFQFVFKMFSQGNAAVPSKGMAQIPNQLKSQLKNTEFQFSTKVAEIENKEVKLEGGDSIKADKIIIATDPSTIIPGLRHNRQKYHDVVNLYFEVPASTINAPLIGLKAGSKGLINNFHFPTDVSKAYASSGKTLLSVSVVNSHKLGEKDLLEQVMKELNELDVANKITHLKTYKIPGALPILDDFQYEVDPMTLRIFEDVVMAGDQLLNPSLNAAMTSGRLAAEAIA